MQTTSACSFSLGSSTTRGQARQDRWKNGPSPLAAQPITDVSWRSHPVDRSETQLYFERRVKEGKATHEVIRMVKRYVAVRYILWASEISDRTLYESAPSPSWPVASL